MPLWVLTHTDAPKTMIAGLVLLNTVLVVLLQVRVSRGADTAGRGPGALAGRRLLIALFCLVLPVSGADPGRASVVVLVAGRDAADPGRADRVGGRVGHHRSVPPADQRGAYVGAFRLGSQLQYLIAPAGLTALGGDHRRLGLVPAAAIFVARRAGDRARWWAGRADTRGSARRRRYRRR